MSVNNKSPKKINESDILEPTTAVGNNCKMAALSTAALPRGRTLPKPNEHSYCASFRKQ